MTQNSVLTKLNQDTTLPINIQDARGVPALAPDVQHRLRKIRGTLIQGFKAAVADGPLEAILIRLEGIADELRGFAFEGVGMGLTQQDLVSPTQYNRVEAFVAGPGAAYEHFVYVGVGLLLGKAPQPLQPYLSQLNPAKVWFAIDGYGFQHGLCHWQQCLDKQTVPEHLSGYDCRVFDQGLGRSIWFSDGTDVACIARTIGAFPSVRQADLWGGIGFVCAYSGGVDRETLQALATAAGLHRVPLSKGAAFAAKSRQWIGSQSPYTDLACEVFWGMSAAEIAEKITAEMACPLPAYRQSNEATYPDRENWQHYRAYMDVQRRAALHI